MKPVEPASLDAIELSTPEFWEKSLPEREGAFLKLRREDPIRKFKEVGLMAASKSRYRASSSLPDAMAGREAPGGSSSGTIAPRTIASPPASLRTPSAPRAATYAPSPLPHGQ